MRTFDRKTTREGWGDGLIDIAELHPDVVVLVGDNTLSTNVDRFAERFPERFFQMGIAEQNMAGVSAGLSIGGKVPYYVTYSAFGVGRAFDQLRVTVAYSHQHVIVGGAHSGLSVGPDGATHQMMEDIALIRSLPGFTLLSPADYWQTRKAVTAAYEIDGPVYIRFGREAVPVVSGEDDPFVPGQAVTMADGNDATCIATGAMVAEALLAHDLLAVEGIGLRVINMHTIKPLDEATILRAAAETRAIVTAEEHQLYGGLGSAVAQVLAIERVHPPVDYVAVMDMWGRLGDAGSLLDLYGLRAVNIAEKVRALL